MINFGLRIDRFDFYKKYNHIILFIRLSLPNTRTGYTYEHLFSKNQRYTLQPTENGCKQPLNSIAGTKIIINII